MGRTEASRGLAPPAVRKDQRAKHAKTTINQVIPRTLASDARARQGVASSELIVDPPKQQAPSGLPSSRGKTRASRSQNEDNGSTELRLRLVIADTISAAQALATQCASRTKRSSTDHDQSCRVGILNMASPLRPGGGVLSGAQAQEEFLCTRTTLLPSLKEEFYRLPEVGGILTRDVLVFRDGSGKDLPKSDRFHISVVSAGMLRFPEVHQIVEEPGTNKAVTCEHEALATAASDDVDSSGGDKDDEDNHAVEATSAHEEAYKTIYSNEQDRQLVVQKMRAVLRMFQKAGVSNIILGAWGCGAYGNPIGEVAAAWRKVLLEGRNRRSEDWSEFDNVIFAIQAPMMAHKFLDSFGTDLKLDSAVDEQDEKESDEVIEPFDEVQELETKIAELELQRSQTRIPDLSVRIGTIIQGLQASLASKHES